jgi:N-methylhydantoinase B
MTLLAPEARVSALTDRTKRGAWGVEGGRPGAPGALKIRRRDEQDYRSFSEAFGTVSDSKFVNVTLRAGDEVLLETPGGGGLGDPFQRQPSRVLNDVIGRFVSVDAARAEYGVAIVTTPSGTYDIDYEATQELRRARR